MNNLAPDSASRAKRREHSTSDRALPRGHSLTHSVIIAWPPENHSLKKCGVIRSFIFFNLYGINLYYFEKKADRFSPDS